MSKRYWIAVAVLALLVPLLAMGQNKAAAQAQTDDNDSASNGQVWGNYTVRQSIELGGRITETSGNQQMYDTLVNLQSGPRLLGQELSMRSNNQSGSLFDNLYLSSFGLGGDPNDMVRLRIEKNKWYNFVGLYRRDQNFFDYDLFANPLTLNPGITNCSTAAGVCTVPLSTSQLQSNYFFTNSPHFQDTTRNMGDFNLTLFPQSAVRVRVGFARTDNQGTIDSTSEDVNIDLTQQTHQRSDRWSFGVDVRPIARTTLSFDQFFEHDKVDVSYVNNPANYTLPLGSLTGTMVTLPLTFLPCTITTGGKPVPFVNAAGVLNAGCNTGEFSYSRHENVRSFFPTSQLSLRSNYFRKLDITASGNYSSGNSQLLNYNELFYGLVSRTDNTAYNISGPANTDRVSGNADLGLTYHISKSWSVSDKFRWLDWRDPGAATQLTSSCYSNLATGETLSTPTGAPCGIAGITTFGNVPALIGTGSSAAPAVGSALNVYSTLEGERTYSNKVTLNWAPSRRLNAYVGYRYQRRELTTASISTTTNTPILGGGLLGTPGTPTVSTVPLFTGKTNENAALAGIVLRPTDKWRVNGDAEMMYADNTFTYISPRHEQRVRASTVYKLNRWASINASVHVTESRNDFATDINQSGLNLFSVSGAGTGASPYVATTNQPAYGNKNHLRYYSLSANLNPTPRVSFDFGWTYMDQLTNSATCMPIASGVVTPAIAASNLCPGIGAGTDSTAVTAGTATSPDLPVVQSYQENTNTGYAILTYRPIHRVALNLGYEITSTSGYDNWLRADTGAPLQVLGDQYGNVPAITGNAGAGTVFNGPFPNQPSGPQDFNWTKVTAGMAIDVCKGVTFKGSYSYYDYNEKEGNVSPFQLVALPRNFHTNMGVVSLKYSF